jgi:peptidoglycan/LPS O-acetylase OafA/YrhL
VYSNSQPEKLDYLLSLRGVAALGVVLGHAFGIGPYSVGVYVSSSPVWYFTFTGLFDHPPGRLRDMLFYVTPLVGTNFVILFFMLSGYLMGKVFHDQKYDFSPNGVIKFYKNRYFRLAPLLYFNLLVGACFFGNASLSPIKLLGDLLFITNFTDRGVNLVTWSLAHEMQYYLLAPFVFRFFRSVSYGALLRLVVLIGIIYAATRSGFLAHFEYLYIFISGYAVNLALRLAPLAVSERVKIAAVGIGTILINVLYNWLFLHGYANLASISVVVVSAAVILVTEYPSTYEVSRLHPRLSLIFRWTMFTGVLSYGIYLWHYMILITRYPLFTKVIDLVSEMTGWTAGWEKVLLYHGLQLGFSLPVTYALATVTFYLIEVRFRPGLYEPTKSAAAPDALAATRLA